MADHSRAQVLDIIEREAAQRGINRDDFLRFAYIETGGTFDETASRGPRGAKGLFQFVPATARAYGIEGRELDPVANTDAAAQLYLANQRSLTNAHDRDGRPYLSGAAQPDGLDMYLAHQQGAAGYRSIQAAIATGEFSRDDTRSNILNNVSSRDLKTVTGVDMATFRNMDDRALAQTFSQYWDTKFDRIQIPEKNIEARTQDAATRQATEPARAAAPVQAAPALPTATAAAAAVAAGAAVGARAAQAAGATQTTGDSISLERSHALTQQFDDVKYGLGAKRPESGKVDCSGWVVHLQNATMDEINQKAGHDVFSREQRFSPGYTSAAGLIQQSEKRSGMLLTGRDVNAANLREGMIIGEDNGATSFDAGRYRGIDHVTMVVRDPRTDALMISQSRGGEGVEMIPLANYLDRKHARGVELFATDPLSPARELLQERGQVQGHGQAQGRQGEAPAAHQETASATLREKDRGESVRSLQQDLNRLGIRDGQGNALQADGQFGAKTEQAVRAFQQAKGLEVDGIVGRDTRAAIAQASRNPLVSDPRHPDHGLFRDASRHLEQLGPSAYANRGELDNAAAKLAQESRNAGLQRIDHVVVARDGRNLFAVQGEMTDPAHQRVQVDRQAAIQQPIEQTSQQLSETRAQASQTQDLGQAQLQEQQVRRAAHGM